MAHPCISRRLAEIFFSSQLPRSCRATCDVLLAVTLLVAAGVGACAPEVAVRRADNPQDLIRNWNGPFPQISIVLGPGAEPGQREDCTRALLDIGVTNPTGAPFSVLIDIAAEEKKILHVRSQARGEILQETRPPWSVKDLCRDALALALRTLQSEGVTVPTEHPTQRSVGSAAIPSYAPPAYAPITPIVPMQQLAPMMPAPAGYAGGGPDDPWQVLTRWTGPAPQVSVILGSRASVRQREICNETVRKFGVLPVPSAPVVAQIDIDNSSRDAEANLLRVTSQRGIMVYGFRPGWKVGQLCTDALAQALRVFLAEYGRMQAASVPGQLQ